jgi:dUTP pyrophosphatase
MSTSADSVVSTAYSHITSKASAYRQFAILKLVITDKELIPVYEAKIKEHNDKMMNDSFMDSGFDLFVPEQKVFTKNFQTEFIDFCLRTEMVFCDVDKNQAIPTAFTVHPRSSLSKTPLMLANHTGIIDSGYRGSLIGAFRWLSIDGLQYVVEKNTRLVQICHPSLCPIYIVIVDENNLSNTIRGDGGFGSTGV